SSSPDKTFRCRGRLYGRFYRPRADHQWSSAGCKPAPSIGGGKPAGRSKSERTRWMSNHVGSSQVSAGPQRGKKWLRTLTRLDWSAAGLSRFDDWDQALLTVA